MDMLKLLRKKEEHFVKGTFSNTCGIATTNSHTTTALSCRVFNLESSSHSCCQPFELGVQMKVQSNATTWFMGLTREETTPCLHLCSKLFGDIIQSLKILLFIKQKQNPKHPPRPQMYLKLTENVLWYSKPMFLHMPLWTQRLCTVTVHHWLTPTGCLLMKRRQPSPGLSPCTQAHVVLSLFGAYTNQGAF